jgi:hypothetical protein
MEVETMAGLTPTWKPLELSMAQIKAVSNISDAERLVLMRKAIDVCYKLKPVSDEEIIKLNAVKVRLRKIYRSGLISTYESADLYKARLLPLLAEARENLGDEHELCLQLQSLIKVKKLESSNSVKKIAALISSIEKSKITDAIQVNVLQAVQTEILEYMEDRGDNMSFLYLMRLEKISNSLSEDQQNEIKAFIYEHKDFTKMEAMAAFAALSVKTPALAELKTEVDQFLLVQDKSSMENFHNAHYIMIFSLFLIGFFLYAPDSLISSMAAIDFGGHRGASSAAGFINGCGSVGSIFSGVGVGYIAQHYNWNVLFNIFAFMALLGMLILLPKWNAVPAEHQLNSHNKKES